MRDAPPETKAGPALFPGELMIWLSASFPVGGFAYSQGLETAVHQQWVHDRPSLTDWLSQVMLHGALRNDLIMLSLMLHATSDDRFNELAELANALQPSAERYNEATGQGRSFTDAYQAAWSLRSSSDHNLRPITLPAALALAAREHTIPLQPTLEAYAIAWANNIMSAAIRLGVVGQFDGQRVTADLLPSIRSIAAFALTATEDDLGSATYGADLAAMLHETQTTRLFRS